MSHTNLEQIIEQQNTRAWSVYEADKGRIREDFGIESTVLAGGYGYRQILELVQNAADAILEGEGRDAAAKIQVILKDGYLYVANTGAPLSEEGALALMTSHSSPKRANQIGRFGLGFKSLLGLKGRIDVFTKSSGAFRFDPDQARDQIRRKFSVKDAPGLRLAYPLGATERTRDPVLQELAWAETVIRAEVQDTVTRESLSREISEFPSEFLLFFSVSTELVLNNGKDSKRVVSVTRDGDFATLDDSNGESRWLLVGRTVNITNERAKADATHIHARDSVPLTWAVPVSGKREPVGHFWAFFPTKTHSYIPGILNAPWKLNADRNDIIAGEWNNMLMEEAANLVAQSLHKLPTDEDPAKALEVVPQELPESSEVAVTLIEALFEKLISVKFIPDMTGKLQLAINLFRHPQSHPSTLEAWGALASDLAKTQLIHPACMKKGRPSRLIALADRIKKQAIEEKKRGLRPVSAKSWFAYVASTQANEAQAVLRLAEIYRRNCRTDEWDQEKDELNIIPDRQNQLRTCQEVVFSPTDDALPAGKFAVADSLADNAESHKILTDIFGVRALNLNEYWKTKLGEAFPKGISRDAPHAWESWWAVVHQAPIESTKVFIKSVWGLRMPKVKTGAGKWVKPKQALLLGRIIEPKDATENAAALINPTFHKDDTEILTLLGSSDLPENGLENGYDVNWEESFPEWMAWCESQWESQTKASARKGYLKPTISHFPAGWNLLTRLRGKPNAKFTEILIHHLGAPQFSGNITFGHTTQHKYSDIRVKHPFADYLYCRGMVQIGEQSFALNDVIRFTSHEIRQRLPLSPSIKNKLVNFIVPAYRVNGLSYGTANYFWEDLFSASGIITTQAIAEGTLSEFWNEGASHGVVPTVFPTHKGLIPISEVFYTSSHEIAKVARAKGQVVVDLNEHAAQLWQKKGAKPLSLTPKWEDSTGSKSRLCEVVPELKNHLTAAAVDEATYLPVKSLTLGFEGHALPRLCLLHQDVLLLDLDRFHDAPRHERLQAVLEELESTDWLNCPPQEAVEKLVHRSVYSRREEVSRRTTLEEKLLCAVGDGRDPLINAIGAASSIPRVVRCSDLELARLFLQIHGPATLSRLGGAMEASGLQPPGRWGSNAASEFIAELGFPPEFAGAQESKRNAEEYITGPIGLPRLHDYQEEVVDGIEKLLKQDTHRKRAVVSLPTGGGKTRCTVEAVVKLILRPEGMNRQVVWIAQSDELCEQAVQCFRQVWLNLGKQNTNLRLIRLWGGNPTPSPSASHIPLVVISTIQTLSSRAGSREMEWLNSPGMVVIDECHHAITKSYTGLLKWIDSDQTKPAKNEPPILGLSATPFRRDDDESNRLAKRFGAVWFPADQEKLYSKLLSEGVLAHARHESLETGVGLSREEQAELDELSTENEGWDIDRFLERLNNRMADNPARNEKLLDCIRHTDAKSILFYTNSVKHAEIMAAHLNLSGIPAAAISGETPSTTRRYFLDKFQRGELRVLCNHSVLTTGFDAPKTDMVLISRQIFSPVRYMQIVGRGLRGPKNGGTPECRIVTVLDNLGRFQGRHSYHYCRQHFTSLDAVMNG